MKTFIRVTEVWVPSRDRTHLELAGGLYGSLTEFGRISQQTRFGYDEGLPGKAWAQGHPIVLKDLENSYFLRGAAAKVHGLTSGIAMPIFAGEVLTSVLVFLCGDDEQHVGAIELWRNDPSSSYDMSLVDGYYGTAEIFEWISAHVLFRPGFGLVGRVWQSGMPLIMADLGHSYRFLRQEDARRVGINKGFGIPCAEVDGVTYVLTFLSAVGTPIANRVEIWVPDATRKALVFESGTCDKCDLTADYSSVRIPRGQGPIGGIWRTAVPAVVEDLGATAGATTESALRAGLKSMVAMPVWNGGSLAAVVAWYF